MNTENDNLHFDRLVDGELNERERRELLAGLDAEPSGWRRCALAFLEAQCWKQTLGLVAKEGERVLPSPDSLEDGTEGDSPEGDSPIFAAQKLGQSPEKSGQSPEKSGQSPEKSGQSPEKSGQSPEKSGQSPEKSGQSPEKSGQSPEKSGQSPEKSGQSPEKSGQSPEKSGQSPEKLGQSPEKLGQSPMQYPRRRSPWPGRLGTVLAMAACFAAAVWVGSFFHSSQVGKNLPSTGFDTPYEMASNVGRQLPVPSIPPNDDSATPRPRIESPSSPWRVVTVSTPSNGQSPGQSFAVPAVERDKLDEQWMRGLPPAIPNNVLQALARTGHEIRQHREYVPVPLKDGRKMVMPVDQVEVHYVGNGSY